MDEMLILGIVIILRPFSRPLEWSVLFSLCAVDMQFHKISSVDFLKYILYANYEVVVYIISLLFSNGMLLHFQME